MSIWTVVVLETGLDTIFFLRSWSCLGLDLICTRLGLRLKGLGILFLDRSRLQLQGSHHFCVIRLHHSCDDVKLPAFNAINTLFLI